MNHGRPSACRWDRLGARGQGWRGLLLLLVHLLEVLLPGPHLCILQLLHMESLSVGQELLPLILQLPGPSEYCYPLPMCTKPCPLLRPPTHPVSPGQYQHQMQMQISCLGFLGPALSSPAPNLLAACMTSHCSGVHLVGALTHSSSRALNLSFVSFLF